ncbi:MAG: type II toxin-antitoxin system RelE/ParE family toxin [Leptospiraceae bacterium]|nr:type II toxin-antitoxin system RelE/ParE family toxin [Leptospiraceae bacterium]
MEEKYKLEPSAKEDIKESYQYYEEQKEGLGAEFLDEVNEKIQEIVEKPEKYSKYYKNVRKTSLKRFPFNILYTIKEKLVAIIGVWHKRREPGKLEKRIDKEK